MNINELADAIERSNDCNYNLDAASTLRKQAEEIGYWKRAFERAMDLNDQVKYLETQVYGGNTK